MEMHDRIVRAHVEMNKSLLAYAADSSSDNTIRVIDAITPLEGIVYAIDHHYVPRGAAGLWMNYLTSRWTAPSWKSLSVLATPAPLHAT
jgi:hypothetical protein